MQVFFERLIIPRFRLIARSSRGTVLEDLCNRLTIDDGIHHSAGVAYERVLLEGASKKTKDRLVKAANQLLPIFVEHALWRPKERAWIGDVMRETDIRRLQDDVRDGIRMASSLGLDVKRHRAPFAGLSDASRSHLIHDPSCFGCGDNELGLRMALPDAEGAETYASEVDVRASTTRAAPGSRTAASSAPRSTRRVALLATWHRFPAVTGADRDPLPPPGPDQPDAAGSRARVTADRGRRIEIAAESCATATSCSPRPTAPSCTFRWSTFSRPRRAAATAAALGGTAARTPQTSDRGSCGAGRYISKPPVCGRLEAPRVPLWSRRSFIAASAAVAHSQGMLERIRLPRLVLAADRRGATRRPVVGMQARPAERVSRPLQGRLQGGATCGRDPLLALPRRARRQPLRQRNCISLNLLRKMGIRQADAHRADPEVSLRSYVPVTNNMWA